MLSHLLKMGKYNSDHARGDFCRLLITFANSLATLAPDQDRQNVGPDLDPNCSQRLLADGIGRQRVKLILILMFLLNHVCIFSQNEEKVLLMG